MNEFASEKLFREGALVEVRESADKVKGTKELTGQTTIYVKVGWMGGAYQIMADKQKFEVITENGKPVLRQFSTGKTFQVGSFNLFVIECAPVEGLIFNSRKFVPNPKLLISVEPLSPTVAPAAKSYAMNPTEEKKK